MSQSKQLTQTALFFALLSALTAVLLIVTVTPSRAAVGDLTFTIEGPGVQASQVSCSTEFVTENFDGAPTGFFPSYTPPLGSYAEGSAQFQIKSADEFGGAGGSGNYISTDGPNSYTLTLDTTKYPNGAGYFGFWWSAGNGNNRVKVNMADGTSQTFSTQTVLDSGNLVGTPGTIGGHFGNPNTGTNAEVYAYVNIFPANDNARIVSLEFSEITGGVGFFESDNHSACADLLDPDTGSVIPQVGSITVVKEANPESEQEFSFLTSIGGPGSQFTLKDNGVDPNSITFNDLPPSVYNVDEFPVPSGWTFTSLECTGGAEIVIGGKNANIYLSGGENVTCTYTNTRLPEPEGKLEVVKVLDPTDDPGRFDLFILDGQTEIDREDNAGHNGTTGKNDVPMGSYIVGEIGGDTPATSLADYDTTISCVDTADGDAPVTATPVPNNGSLEWEVEVTEGSDIVCTFTNSRVDEPGNNICPAESAYVGDEVTLITGTGMYPRAARTVTIPNASAATGLYAQLAGKQAPNKIFRLAKFKAYDGKALLGEIKNNTVDSAAYRADAVFWFGADLDSYAGTADRINGRLAVPRGNPKDMPRALIIYTDYPAPVPTFNFVQRLADSRTNHVYWNTSNGWIQKQTHTIDLGGPLAESRDIDVQVAIVDNDKDSRPVRLEMKLVDGGGTSLDAVAFSPTKPSHRNMLNIISHVFVDAPQGAAQVILTLRSPVPTGDSAAMVGMAANYACVETQ